MSLIPDMHMVLLVQLKRQLDLFHECRADEIHLYMKDDRFFFLVENASFIETMFEALSSTMHSQERPRSEF